MARAIVRWSISGENNNATGLAVRKHLESFGFERRGTGTWELDGAGMPALITAIGEALEVMTSSRGGGKLDNVWIYADDAEHN